MGFDSHVKFFLCDQIPEKVSLEEERSILAHNFRDFSPRSLGSIASGSVVRRENHGGRMWQRRAVHLMAANKQRERVRESEKEFGNQIIVS